MPSNLAVCPSEALYVRNGVVRGWSLWPLLRRNKTKERYDHISTLQEVTKHQEHHIYRTRLCPEGQAQERIRRAESEGSQVYGRTHGFLTLLEPQQHRHKQREFHLYWIGEQRWRGTSRHFTPWSKLYSVILYSGGKGTAGRTSGTTKWGTPTRLVMRRPPAKPLLPGIAAGYIASATE